GQLLIALEVELGVGHEVLVDRDLVVGLVVHEHEAVAFAVEVFERLVLDEGCVQFVIDAEALLGAVDGREVLEFDLDVDAPVALGDAGGFLDDPEGPVPVDDLSLANINRLRHVVKSSWCYSSGGACGVLGVCPRLRRGYGKSRNRPVAKGGYFRGKRGLGQGGEEGAAGWTELG